ncbi:Transcriptional repressor SdpR [Defluviimonas aquaemixtae]|uniref:Transcriptional repressor SdpR n=1 Tax=Albidovulum aquaemixtae TaxID=1542388 RepID=A0A2R8BKY8_9RHOB|nr:metalloregulator ArsR/SmtB family transcription factor [Defluviimonas aquaemixtae]SPH24065.1 Transcriptional repressor SdpR [Defluviimonas aquaemixtae]
MPQLPALFAALSDETRFSIVERLLGKGEQSAGDLADVADITAPAISRHLKVLREAGIVTQRIDGQRRIYAVAPESLQAISSWVIAHRDFWEGSLNRLEAAIENRRTESF